MSDWRAKAAAISTFLGISLIAIYVQFGLANIVLTVITVALLFTPVVLYAVSEKAREYAILLLVPAVGSLLSIWLLGSGFVQGSDGPAHVVRAKEISQTTKFEVYQPARSLSSQAVSLYFETNIGAEVLGLPIHSVLLILTSSFGIVSVLLYYILVRRVFNTKTAAVAATVLGASIMFLVYGREPRTASMAIPILLLVCFAHLLYHESGNKYWVPLIAGIPAVLFLTHTVITIYYVTIGSVVLAILLASNAIRDRQISVRGLTVLIPSIVLFTVSAYILGSFPAVVDKLVSVGLGAASILSGVEASSTSSRQVGGEGLGLVIFSSVWVARIVFVAGALYITYQYLKMLMEGKPPVREGVLLAGSAVFLGLSLIAMLAGDIIGFTSTRVYRAFEYFAAIVSARLFVSVLDIRPKANYIITPLIVGFVILTAIGGLGTLQAWEYDTGLPADEDGFYGDIDHDDVGMANFAGDFILQPRSVYVGGWAGNVLNAYSDVEIINSQYISPNSSKVTEQDMIYFVHRSDGGQYTTVNSQLTSRSNKIYSNEGVSIYQTRSEWLEENISR